MNDGPSIWLRAPYDRSRRALTVAGPRRVLTGFLRTVVKMTGQTLDDRQQGVGPGPA